MIGEELYVSEVRARQGIIQSLSGANCVVVPCILTLMNDAKIDCGVDAL